MSETAKLIQSELDEAWKCIFKRDISIALEHAKKASLIAPQSPDVAHVLGVIACRDDRHDIALPLLQKALEGGITQRRLRDMAEALLLAGHAEAALAPIQDAIQQFGESSETLGLLAAIHSALNQFELAETHAQKAVALSPHSMAWDATVAFCKLMHLDIKAGFEWFTGRSENLPAISRCPALFKTAPCEIWLKNEQGPGDTLFYLRYAKYLSDLGFKLHVKTDKKTKALLNNTGLFASVKETLSIPHDGFWLNMGDLPLAAMQLGCDAIASALPLPLDAKRVEKIKQKLAEFGPAPYVAVTWRAGPRGKLQNNGLRKYNKHVAPEALGQLLADKPCTVIAIQRVPEPDEAAAFKQGLGRDFADFSALNDQLQDMLALLSLVDLYVTVPNTNVHLRQSLNKDMLVLVNQPWQDWRWLPDGNSPWYPNATVFRQAADKTWVTALSGLNQALFTRLGVAEVQPSGLNETINAPQLNPQPTSPSVLENIDALLAQGWTAINQGKVTDAILVAKQVLSLHPNNPEALHLLGWSAHRDLKTELAASILEQAHLLAPENTRILSNLVRVLALLKRYQDAHALLDAAFQHPHLAAKDSLFAARAVLNQQQNRIHESIADYEETLIHNPNSLNVMEYLGMAKLKIGDARAGFRACTARKDARIEGRADGHVCPWLKSDIAGLRILIKRNMGLGDELTYLRYLPWLIEAGAHITYWAGKKLAPLLERMALGITVISDDMPHAPSDAFDLVIWVNELPVAVEQLDAPEIAPSLALSPRPDLVEKWKQWLQQLGPAPYIGFNWRAGASAEGAAVAFSKLSKSVEPQALANCLSSMQGTFVSLQRNVFSEDIKQFAQFLNSPVHDASALTDDLEDLLALLSLLDENIGVSNTNMHLRAGLSLGSRVLVQCPGGDWRWGYEGNTSLWFEHSKVYRQHLDGDWKSALNALSQDLTTQYPQKLAPPNNVSTSHTNHVSAHKVIWLTAGKLEATATGYTSDLASARYRVILPAAELTRTGLNNVFVNESISQAMGGWGSHTPQNGDTLIISKVFTTHALALANDAKKRGAKVVVDFCDNFFDHPTRGPLQKALLAVADQVVASTEVMAEVLTAQGKPTNAVISDPVELAQGKAKFSPTNTLKLLWFGHAVNIDTLAQCLPQLAELSFTVPLCLNVVTTLPNGADDLAKIVPSGLDVRYTPWSVAATKAAIDDCDLVIIPTIASELKKAKSPNRLLEPLWAGRMVVAGRLPAYLPFGDSAWVGKDIIQGVQWALNNPQEVINRIQQGQQDIADYFSQTTIANAWMQVIAPKSNSPATKAPILSQMNPQAPSALTQKRLNLGCGDKILPGYINVDVVASRAGKTPDVLCDLHHLSPFEDNSVDEILSVHVVEHFWRWEVLDILKEWVRVLKPGGKMVLECPNLLAACEEFLKNPEAAAFGGPEGQRSMWVFYGDPRWKDPYMVHRWGYTPQSLAKLMHEAGLVNARQMPAQYKLKEPRDMRIEAYKP